MRNCRWPPYGDVLTATDRASQYVNKLAGLCDAKMTKFGAVCVLRIALIAGSFKACPPQEFLPSDPIPRIDASQFATVMAWGGGHIEANAVPNIHANIPTIMTSRSTYSIINAVLPGEDGKLASSLSIWIGPGSGRLFARCRLLASAFFSLPGSGPFIQSLDIFLLKAFISINIHRITKINYQFNPATTTTVRADELFLTAAIVCKPLAINVATGTLA